MATTNLEIPVGSGNFVKVNVDAYNNLSQEQRSAFYDSEENQYKQQIQNQKKEQRSEQKNNLAKKRTSTTGEKITGSARGLGQGLLLGFGDELEAGVRTGFGLLGDYGETVGGIRQDIDDFRVSNPALAYGTEIGGAILPALFTGGAGAVATAGRMGVGQLAKQGAKQGAKFGGAYGLGTAESDPGASVYDIAKDRAIGLGGGALIGGATGGVLNPVIGKSMQGMSALFKNLRGGEQGNVNSANRSIAKAFQNETDDTIKAVSDDTVNPTMLADVGENTRSLGYSTQQIANPSRSPVAKSLNARNNEQSARILDTVKNTTGISDEKIGFRFVDKLDNDIEELAKPFYKEAYEVKIPFNKFRKFFDTDTKDVLIQASKEGQKLMNYQSYKTGQSAPDLTKMFKVNPKTGFGSFDDMMNQELDTVYFHSIKRGLDKMVNAKTDPVTGKVTDDGRILNNLKNDFNEIIKANNPAYAKANKRFADTQKLREAFELGGKYKNTTIRKIKRDLSKMTPEEQEAWKSGMVTRLEDVAQGKKDSTNFLNEIDGSNKLDEIFDFLISDPKQKEAFLNILKSEKKMNDTFALLRQNSNTASKSNFINEFKNDDKILSGSVGEMVGKGITKGIDTLRGGTLSKRAELVAEKLFSTDKSVQKKVLDQLKITNKELAKEVEKRLSTALKITKGGARSIQVLNEGTGSKQELLDALNLK